MKNFSTKPRSGFQILPLACAILLLGGAALAEAPEQKRGPLPAPSVTEHSIEVGDRKLAFKATASALPVKDAQSGEVLVEIATLAFTMEPPKAEAGGVLRRLSSRRIRFQWWTRGWVRLARPRRCRTLALALGRRRSVDTAAARRQSGNLARIRRSRLSRSARNGRIRACLPMKPREKAFLSVDGDIEMLAVVIRRWTLREHRQACAKYLLGESYGGFRAPKIVRALQESKISGSKA